MRDQINDCFVEVHGRKPTDKEIDEISSQLPNNITLLAAQWGWNDTEVGDMILKWLRQ
jgi:hypothetical protein